jgi:hypothetical protein
VEGGGRTLLTEGDGMWVKGGVSLDFFRQLARFSPIVADALYKKTVDTYLKSLGWVWVPTMQVGSGCTVHLRADELPTGTIVARVSRHYCTVIDGVIHDTHDYSRGGTRCVYGYWKLGQEKTANVD